jgi:branched-chain amino acid aminotransferase
MQPEPRAPVDRTLSVDRTISVDRTLSVDRTIWMDGELVPWDNATVHVLSHSLQRGSLIFDYLSVHATARGPAIFRLREHVERFQRSAELVGLPLGYDREAIEAAVVATVAANPGAQAVKVCAYFASIEVDVVPLDDRVSLTVAAYDPGPDIVARKPRQPDYHPLLSLWIEKDRRNRRDDIMPPQAKVAANYVSPMGAKWAAQRAGYHDILLVDEQGFVAEGPTTNVFLVEDDGGLCTPSEEKVLLGVTRSSVIAIAKHEGIPVCETSVRPERLLDAAEVFITGTTAGVWPVGSIDGRPIGDGAAGPVSRRLQERFRKVVSGDDPAFSHWLTSVNED